VRSALLVLGMHRSGTSALTRVLSLHGPVLPGDLLAGRADNPRGFFESGGMVALDDRMLAALDRAWDDARSFPPDAAARLAGFVPDCVALLRDQVPPDAAFVLKDPRACRLLPAWLPALDAVSARPFAVMAARNPLEVASSLATRNGMAKRDALRLWLAHVLAAERDTRGIGRVVVHYDDLLRDWRSVLARIGIAVRGEGSAATEAFLARALRHHEAGTDALLRDPAVPAVVKRVHAELRRAPAEEGLDPAVFDAAAKSVFLLG
jgi:hypothetical protein